MINGISKNNLIKILVCTIVMAILIIAVGPCNVFKHGFFAEEIDVSKIYEQDMGEDIPVNSEGAGVSFVPKKNDFAGFSILLAKKDSDDAGVLELTIYDESNNLVDKAIVDLKDVQNMTYYKVYTKARLKKGSMYTVKFTSDAAVPLYLKSVNNGYLPKETISGNVILAYAYKEATFSPQEKVLIAMFIIAIWLFICATMLQNKARSIASIASVIIFMTSVLSWNYMYTSMDDENIYHKDFQVDSEALVTGMIYAEQDGSFFWDKDELGYGLGYYYDLKGKLRDYTTKYTTNDTFVEGYSTIEPAITVNGNMFTWDVAVAGNYIGFENGDVYRISYVDDAGDIFVIHLESTELLSEAKNGSLDEISFYDGEGTPLYKSRIVAYKSQYGLQGKVFRILARFMDKDQVISNLWLICSIITALVFAVIVLLIYYKYNAIFAGCFFATFWLSPWVIDFARNLYWVEFTWFLPMAVGIFCAMKIDNKMCRILSYLGAFVSILIKSLCGYEYISTVMMGLISILLVDFVVSFIKKDTEKAKLLFRTTVLIGIMALAGFIAAMCIHAPLKGDGSIVDGIRNIIEQDVLRRTNGADLNNFDDKLWPSMNASIWETFCLYFHFKTSVITGIPGNLFGLLCIVPLIILGYEVYKKKADYEAMVMYVVFFLSAVSWFCLAKSHSYIHTHMNFVMWYFGFVQICMYIIVSRIVAAFKERKAQ